MKRLLLAVLLCLPFMGCEGQNGLFVPPAVNTERPLVNPPTQDRQKNWRGNKNEGSCVWASTITLLRWQGRYATAEKIRRKYGNGEWPDDWMAKMEAEGLRYSLVTNGDVSFLETACHTRRGAAVTIMGGKHMVNLVHLDDKWACLLDNNDPGSYHWVSRASFLAEWKASYGWALTPIYTPAAPLPQ